jgi:hypothetical protein
MSLRNNGPSFIKALRSSSADLDQHQYWNGRHCDHFSGQAHDPLQTIGNRPTMHGHEAAFLHELCGKLDALIASQQNLRRSIGFAN